MKCQRCNGFYGDEPPEFAIYSDILALLVCFRCAIEAALERQEFPAAQGQMEIGVPQ